jgi:predicted lactoylglutathione lyase
MIFVNLPVADLAKARAFYEAIGAVNQPKFTDETATCMVFSDATFIMLLTHDKFRQFTSTPALPREAASFALRRTAWATASVRSSRRCPRLCASSIRE